MPCGRGKYTWADGGYYQGDYKAVLDKYKHKVVFPNPNGKRHGKGVRVYANGNRYEGDWRDDRYHGKGTLSWATGGKYVGEFRNGLFHGRGEAWYGAADGQPYINPLGYVIYERGKK